MSQDLVAQALNNAVEPAAAAVAKEFQIQKDLYGSYNMLPYELAVSRVKEIMEAIIQSVQANSSVQLKEHMQVTLTASLRSGYDPNELVRAVELIAQKLGDFALSTLSADEATLVSTRRRLGFLTTVAKLHIATLNMAIPDSERNEIDPGLLKLN
jgi:hypothetical protein